MTIEETIAAAVGAQIRPLLDELRALRDAVRPAAADGYLSVEKAAQLAEVHGDTVRGWIKAGKIPEHRAGRELRVRRDELHRFLAVAAGAGDARPSVEEEAAAVLAKRRKEA